MRAIALIFAALAAACTTSSGVAPSDAGNDADADTGGGGGPVDSAADVPDAACMNHPMTGNPACDSCGQTSCPTQYAACFSGGACAAYVACFCACPDQTCVKNCGSLVDQTCASCVATLTACQKSACSGVCP